MPVTSSIFFERAGQVPEENERFVERIPVGIRWAPTGAAGGIGPNHMVIGEDMVITQFLGRLRVISNRYRVGANFGLGKDDSKTHIFLLRLCL